MSMAPSIATEGQGIVSIGGQSFTIHQQMIEDFRQQRLRDRVRSLQKPVLIFHSPEDETVAFEHALINSGYRSETHARGHQPDGLSQRTLVALPGSNHLLTSSDRDIPMIVRIIHAWCDRLI